MNSFIIYKSESNNTAWSIRLLFDLLWTPDHSVSSRIITVTVTVTVVSPLLCAWYISQAFNLNLVTKSSGPPCEMVSRYSDHHHDADDGTKEVRARNLPKTVQPTGGRVGIRYQESANRLSCLPYAFPQSNNLLKTISEVLVIPEGPSTSPLAEFHKTLQKQGGNAKLWSFQSIRFLLLLSRYFPLHIIVRSLCKILCLHKLSEDGYRLKWNSQELSEESHPKANLF